VLALVTVFFAASAVVSELRDAMNTIWRVPEDTTSSAVRSIFDVVKDRLLLVWVYYSAEVLFLGAEFRRAYACRFGSMCVPNDDLGRF